MCICAERGKGCVGEKCDYCIARHTDAEYAVLEKQKRELEEALAITKLLMQKRSLEMKMEVNKCANGSNSEGQNSI